MNISEIYGENVQKNYEMKIIHFLQVKLILLQNFIMILQNKVKIWLYRQKEN